MGLQIKTGDPARDKILFLIADMKYKELKMNCLERGLAFELAVALDAPRLSGWLVKHWDNPRDLDKLKLFDQWKDGQLANKYPADHPIRQYKEYSMPEPESEKVEEKPKKEKTSPKPKIKKEKDTTYNIYKGTKKELVYSLTGKLKKDFGEKYNNKKLINKFFEQMMEKVKKKFPNDNVNEKSIRIWMKRCLDNA